MIGGLIAPVAAHEGAQRHVLRCLDLVGSEEAEALLVPGLGSTEVAHLEHGMADSADVRGCGVEPHGAAEARLGSGGVTVRIGGRRLGIVVRLASDHLDVVAVRIGQADDPPAAWLAQVFHRYAFVFGELVQIGRAFGTQAERQETGFTGFGNVHEGPPVAGLAVKPAASLEARQAEVFQKAAHRAKVRRGVADVGNVLGTDHAHGFSPRSAPIRT